VFERFTPQARAAIVRVQEDARELGQPRITTPLLLLGVAGERDSAGARVLTALGVGEHDIRDDIRRASERRDRTFSDEDQSALRSVGIVLDEVRRSVEETFGPGALDRGRGTPAGHIPFTRGAKKALELSVREAIALGHKHIGIEHLLLGLVRDERCSAAMLLAARGIDRERVHGAVLHEIASGGDQPGRTA
jgi:ATP-dependent Clp protease ATP-binding subunit ClpA